MYRNVKILYSIVSSFDTNMSVYERVWDYQDCVVVYKHKKKKIKK